MLTLHPINISHKYLGKRPVLLILHIINISSYFPHLFTLLCWVDVSYETPPFNPVLRFLQWQFSLRQVGIDVIHHLRFSFPILPFPGTSITITLLLTYSSSLLNTCPYHLNLLSCTFTDISPTLVVHLILSFLILSSLVTPLIHLNTLISATSNIFFCAFFTANVSASYIIAGLSTIWTSSWFFSTQNPRYPLPVFHPDCILCAISASSGRLHDTHLT